MLSQIRKFGLEHCDLPTTLWNVSVLLKVLTLNIDSKNRKGIPIFFYIITIAGFLCYFYAYLGSMLWFVFVRVPETGEVLQALVVLSLGISSEIGTLKLFYMFLYIDKIRNLTDAILEFDSQINQGSRVSVNMLKYMRNVKKRAIIYWVVIMGDGCLYVLKPFLIPGRHLSEDSYVIYGLEPMFDSPNYEIASYIMGASVFLICYITSNITGYQIVIIGYVESQMLALSDEISHIWTDAEEYYKTMAEYEAYNVETDKVRKNKIINEHISDGLKEIMKQHATIKNLMAQVENVTRSPIAIGFSFLIIGLICELLGGLENTYLQIPFTVMPVAIDCFIGQRVIDAAEIFEQAVYDCKWENFDKTNMKMVLVMLQISQKTMAISAGGLTKMSFRCLMAAMRATYSAYTALRSVM